VPLQNMRARNLVITSRAYTCGFFMDRAEISGVK